MKRKKGRRVSHVNFNETESSSLEDASLFTIHSEAANYWYDQTVWIRDDIPEETIPYSFTNPIRARLFFVDDEKAGEKEGKVRVKKEKKKRITIED